MFHYLHTTLVMTAKIAVLAVVFAAFTTQAAGPGPKGGPSAEKLKKPNYVEGELLVKFKREVGDARAEAVHGKFNARKLRQYKSVRGLQHVKLPKGLTVEEAVAAYKKDPNIAYAEPNYLYYAQAIPDDTEFSNLWGLDNASDTDINAPEAWDITTGAPNVVVAVIDSGIDYNHGDLAANMWVNVDEANGLPNVDDDGNNFVDDIHGYDFYNDDGDPMDDADHGTHVAGTIAAVGNNGIGVTGVSWEAKLIACKFLGSNGTGPVSAAINCLDYIEALKVGGENIVVTNNSWGGDTFSQALYDAAAKHLDAGILFIAAAGNGIIDGTNNDSAPIYPASFDLPNIVSVAATDDTDTLARFSNYGRRTVHVAAPGVDILSTMPAFSPLSYDYKSGTSMAAPHVTGLAALLEAQSPGRGWVALKNLILAGGQNTASVADTTITGKRIRAADGGGVGSLTCSGQVVNERLLPITDTVEFTTVGSLIDLAALHINCATPNGDVTVDVLGPSGPATVTLADDATTAPDQFAGDGIYSNQWSASLAGAHVLTFPGGDAVMVLENYEPPTNFAYSYRTITGTDLGLGNDQTASFTSPFPIRFGGHPSGLTELHVASNGFISFTEAATDEINRALPEAAFDTLVAPFWEALDLTTGGVFWEVQGVSPDQELVIEWRGVANKLSSCVDTGTFQVVFFEGKPDILFNYADVDFGGISCDGGRSATVGVQVSTTAASLYSVNTASLSNNQAIMWRTINHVPSGDTQTVPVDEDNSVNVTLTGTDPDGDSISYAVDTAPVNGTLTGTEPNLTYTPNDPDFNGADSFTFTVSDGALSSAPATVTVNVLPVNDAPVAQDGTLTAVKNTPKDGVLMASDVDVGDTLTYSIVGDGALGQAVVTDAATGAYTYTPNPDVTGTDSFTFIANDGLEDSNIATVTVTIVDPPPSPPPTIQASGGGGGGCSLGRSGGVDPVLLLLLTLSSLYALRRQLPGARRLAAGRRSHTGN